MKPRNRLFLTLLFLAVMIMLQAFIWPSASMAQGGPVTLITDDNGIDGFDRYKNTLYYWNDASCMGPSPELTSSEAAANEYDTIATTGPLGVAPLFTVKTEECTFFSPDVNQPLNVVRDGMYVYFAFGEAHSIHRKTVSSLLSQPSQPFCAAEDAFACAGVSTGSLLADDGYLYWSRFNANDETNVIMRAPFDGSTSPELVLTAVGQTKPIYKLERITYENDNEQEVTVFLGLTGYPNGGQLGELTSTLYRYQPFGQGQGIALKVEENIADFAVHRTWSFGGCCQINAYLAKGVWRFPSDWTAGQNDSALLRYNIVANEMATVYEPAGLEQVLRVTTDSDLLSPFGNTERRIYFSEYQAICPDDIPDACYAESPAIKRNTLPIGGADWETIVVSLPGGGRPTRDGYLRSDDLWLYMRYLSAPAADVEIAKISTDAPPVALDVVTLGLEVVQTIQTMAMEIPLVAWKPTYAKGYATMAVNNTGKATWPVTAQLRGFLNGNELPGSPLSPVNNPILDGTTDLEQLRAGNDNRGMYLFELPFGWVQKGQLALVMVLDPKGALPETGSVNNNVVILDEPATVIERGFTCLDTARIWTNPMIPLNNINGMAQILARARSLLPVFDFHVFHSGERIEKPVFKVIVECGFYFPGVYACPAIPQFVDEPYVFTGGSGEFKLAMFWMAYEEFFGHIDSDCAVADDHLLGMIHPGAVPLPGTAGIASDWPNNLLVRMDPMPQTGSPPWDAPNGGFTLAHELGHNYGRSHINQNSSSSNCGGSTPEDPSSYPYDGCAFGRAEGGQGDFGFDYLTRTAIHPSEAADLMSYASDTWISDFTYNAIAAAIDEEMVAAQLPRSTLAGPTILVSGIITPAAGVAQFIGVHNLPDGVASAELVAQAQAAVAQAEQSGEQTYTLRLLDGANQELATETIAPLYGGELGDDVDFFLHYVAYRPGTVRLLLMDGDDILAEQSASQHAPVLLLDQPTLDEATNTLQLTWNAYDEDNTGLDIYTDMIVYTALYSADNGQTWNAVESNFTTRALVLDASVLPGSDQARLRIIAGDGFHATVATTDAFVMPDHAPNVIITGLRDGQRLQVGEFVQVYGLAMDADQGSLPGDQLSWQLSGPQTAEYSGSPLNLSLFDPGEYRLQLTVEDDSGRSNNASIAFEVLPLAIMDADEPTLDGICNDSAYSSVMPLPLSTDDGPARFWMFHADGALFVCFSDMLRSDVSNTTPKVATLRVDVDASGGAQTGSGDIGFEVNQNSVPRILSGGAAPMAEDATPPAGYSVVVNHVGDTWSAEMRIEESLLGGWDHAVRMMALIGRPNQIGGIEATWPVAATANGPASWAAAYLGQPAPPRNQKPVADAGEDQIVHIPHQSTVSLYGDNSHDADGNRLSYQWTQLSGPNVRLENAQTANPSFTVDPPDETTTLVFQLVVADARLESEADEVVVTLLPTPPASPIMVTYRILLPVVAR